MGTPEFAVPTLERLVASDHDLAAVVTRPDRRRGRGQQMASTPVKQFAEAAGIPVLQPEEIGDPSSLESLQDLEADLFVVVAFVLLPKSVLGIPRHGSINLHPSLLPKYRGAAPINWAIIQGERETGITVFRLSPRMDAGDILHQRTVEIEPDETAGELSDRLMLAGAYAVHDAVDGLASGHLLATPQQTKGVTRAPKLAKEDGRIDWSCGADEIRNLIRGTNPFPGAFTTLDGKELKVHRAMPDIGTSTPGEVVLADAKAGLSVATGKGVLMLQEVQPAGKGRITGAELVRGYRVRVGDRLG